MKHCCHYMAKPSAQKKESANSGAGIINRREIEPLLLKAFGVITSYQQAAECTVALLDQSGGALKILHYKNRFSICELCRKYHPGTSQDGQKGGMIDAFPCAGVHSNSMLEAHRAGGTFIYMCELGFVYWISLIYAGGRQIGALNAGQVLGIERREAVKRLCVLTNGAIPEEEAQKYIDPIPERTYEEVKALVQMLNFCAEQLAAPDKHFGTAVPRTNYEGPKSRNQKTPPTTGQKEHNPTYPLDKERLLLAALRRGDHDSARRVLHELLDSIIVSNPGNFEFIQLRAIELVVLLSREALNAGPGEPREHCRPTLEVNNRYLKKIQDSRNVEELIETLYGIIDCIGGRIFSFQGVRHASALRKAERFIWENYTRKLSLQEIAEVSGLSASYFSSIFKEEMGENLSSYLNRLRVEKAAVMLRETDLSLNEISATCGFEDQSWFSKIFKGYAGMSPGKYREHGGPFIGIKEPDVSTSGV